jgi:hypothetical protein
MLEKPDAADLLATARQLLLEELLPHLPEGQKLAARMVANAMAISGREAAADQAAALAALRGLFPSETTTEQAQQAQLAAAIRAGAHDPGTAGHAAVAEALRLMTRLRVSVSNPRALRN